MSLFDSLASDKTPLVLDVGAKYTKIGCAGELSPRFIVPTEVTCPKTKQRRAVFSYEDDADLRLLLVEFIHTVYFKYFLVSPKDKQVVVVESLLCPLRFKQILANVLYSHYEVGSVVFVPSHLVSLCALGIRTALVVDVGYTEVQVIPVYELVPVLSAWQAQPIASHQIEKRLRDRLEEVVRNETNKTTQVSSCLPHIDHLTQSDLEDIKVRGCFVTTVERGKLLACKESLPAPHPPSMEYRLKGDHVLTVPGLVRESAYECLFEQDNDALSLPNLILDSILKDLKQMDLSAATPEEVPDTPPPNELLNIGTYRMTSLNIFDKLYKEYQEVSERCHIMKQNLTESVEKHRALLKGHQFMLEVEEYESKHGVEQTRSSAGVPFASRFTVQVGALPSAKCNTVETLIWRLTQGNALVRFFPIEPRKYMGKIVGERRTIILVSVQGVKSAATVTKLCHGFGIVLNHMSWKPAERSFILNRVLERIFELRGVLNEANGHRKVLLEKTAENCKTWFIEIEKMKATYSALNNLEWTTLENHAVLTFWVPKSRVNRVFRTILGVTRSEGVSSPVLQKITYYTSSPPTYIRTNKFTEAFQHIINAYGIPSYRELNPMPYTVITFPFIFAIMFGDVGHGLIMTVFSSTVISFENRIQSQGITNEIQSLIFKGRYIILMMGLFSIWTGLIYNDYFSQSLFLWYSHWRISNYDMAYLMKVIDIQLDPAYDYVGSPFPIGIDPIWKLAENDIIFSNALKMKVAIIVGVSQMTFGIILNLLNHLHFKNYLAVFTEFLPQIIFFTCIFVYLVFLFFFKWTMYDAQGPQDLKPGCAPSILITFINMMMFSFVSNPDPTCRREMYYQQELVQRVLLITALLCVPVMFFVEPIIEIVRLKRNKQNMLYVDDDEGVMSIMVHQFIHVIEFCLGSVSYTASYLRLWALSLAHYQLSSVLWKMVLKIGAPNVGIPLGVLISLVTFVFFASFTITILVVIEGLSAFLHALRLHWMEFQSKFYIGLGHHFAPFSFRPILQEAKIPLELYPYNH